MNPGKPIRIGVVEDDARLRRTLTEVLASAWDCQCAGVFPAGRPALAGLPSLQPDVILMDINLPDMTGVDCVAQLAPQLPQTQILMLTVYQDTETIFRALAAGAHGYLVKPVLPEKLLEAIREVRAGGVPMSRSIARQVIQFFHRPPPSTTPGAASGDSGLGPREQQVLEFLVAGLSYKEIASELDIKTSTVGTYVQRIYEKLHVRSRREIIAHYRGAEETRKG
jgi:DNA-binding NarL/FixJ family response regulator